MIRFTMVMTLFLVMTVSPALAGTNQDEGQSNSPTLTKPEPGSQPGAKLQTRSTLERWKGGPRAAALRAPERSLPFGDPARVDNLSLTLIQSGLHF